MGSQVALVKGNRQMGFQVDRAPHIFQFQLNEVARWDLMWLWLKGIFIQDFRLTELHTFFGFGKGDRQMGSQVNKKKERERKKERKKRKKKEGKEKEIEKEKKK